VKPQAIKTFVLEIIKNRTPQAKVVRKMSTDAAIIPNLSTQLKNTYLLYFVHFSERK
jgi:hypothetical protein